MGACSSPPCLPRPDLVRLTTAASYLGRAISLSSVMFVVLASALMALALKVGLALWMFGIAQGLARRRRARPATGRLAEVRRALGSPRTLLWLGTIVVLLAAILKTLYENALRTP